MIKNYFKKFRQFYLKKKVLSFGKLFIINSNTTLIIAPHPDDETFGCAGLISLKVRHGADVSIIFLTNGEESLPEVSQEEIILHRQDSAQRVAASLGVKQTYFMNFPDGNISRQEDRAFEAVVDKIAELIEKIAPLEVFCTHKEEGWSDHRAAAELTKMALQKLNKQISFYYYWVWVWFSVPLRSMEKLDFSQTFYLPIFDVIQKKQALIKLYLNDLHVSKIPYCGRLPKIFLKAFQWPYEVYEKVEYK